MGLLVAMTTLQAAGDARLRALQQSVVAHAVQGIDTIFMLDVGGLV